MVGIIFSRNDFNAPALEAITFAGRLSGGQGDGVASEVEVVEVDRAVVIGVVDSGHILDVLSTGSERNGCEVQIAGELVAGFCRIAGLHVLFVYGLVQGRPGDLLGDLVRNAGFEGDVGRQLLSNCAQLCVIAEVQIARQRHCIEGKAADRNVAEAVVAAEAETGESRIIQGDGRIELARGQRCKIAVQSCIRVDVVRGDLPVGDEVRPAVDGLAGDVRGLAFAAPEGEGVAVAGRSGRVCGGQSRANAGLGGTEDALRLGVVVLICRQRFQRIEVNDRNQLGDDELEILPVSGDQQLLQSGGFILQTVQIPLVAVEHAVVVPAAVDLEVEIEIAARIDLRKVNRIASKLIGGVRNIHDRLAQIAGLEDHEVDVGLFGFPLRNIGHSLRDRCRNFGLPACEGVAGAGRGAVERGGRGILPKVRIDLIGENFFVLNAVGVGDGVYLRHKHAALRLDLPAVPDPDQRDRNDLLIVLDMFRGRERLVELGHIGVGVIADVAKPVVPDLLRLADEVVFIVLAEQAVVLRMLLRIIYDALDQNSHFKLFQLVSRRGFGLAGDLDDRADRPQAVHRDKLPLCILPNPAHRGDCVGVGVFVARKVFVKFFYVLIPKDRNGIRPDAIDLLNRWVGFCVAAKLRHVIPLFIRLVLAYYPNILLPAGNDRLCGRGLGLVAFDFNVSINAVRATNQVPRAILPPPVDAGFHVWLRIGVGSADILIELRNVFRSVQSDGIDVSIFRPIPTEVIV